MSGTIITWFMMEQTISLRPSVAAVHPRDVRSIVGRIAREYGSFRDLHFDGDLVVRKGEDAPVEQEGSRLEEKREELLRLVGVALNECALSLDFCSLALSRGSKSAVDSLSPLLKERIPIGSLASMRLQPQSGYHEQRPIDGGDASDTCKGLRQAGLRRAGAMLSDCATRTETGIKTGDRFWRLVEGMGRRGWRLQRSSKRGSAGDAAGVLDGGLRVRYGQVPGQSMLLRVSNDGAVDPSGLQVRDYRLIFLLCRSGTPIAASHGSSLAQEAEGEGEQGQVEGKLRRAQQSIIATDMYRALFEEARESLALGFQTDDASITVPLGGDETMVIKLACTEEAEEEGRVIGSEQDAIRLETAARAVEVLWARQAMASQKERAKPPLIVRKIVERMRHGQEIARGRHLFESLEAFLLRDADIGSAVEILEGKQPTPFGATLRTTLSLCVARLAFEATLTIITSLSDIRTPPCSIDIRYTLHPHRNTSYDGDSTDEVATFLYWALRGSIIFALIDKPGKDATTWYRTGENEITRPDQTVKLEVNHGGILAESNGMREHGLLVSLFQNTCPSCPIDRSL